MTWKNWLGYLGLAVAIVLVSFIVEWHIRTDWQMYWLDGFIRWWADFVMFGWVKDYQTLVGGIFALGAGAFVMLSAVYQRHTAAIDAARMSRQQLEIDLARAAVGYRRVLHQIRQKELAGALETVRSFDGTLLAFALSAGSLANWLLRINQLVDKHLVKAISEQEVGLEWPDAADEMPRKRALGYAMLAVEYLSFTNRLVSADGKFTHIPRDRALTESRLLADTGLDLTKFAYSEFVIS